jgi:hypothetical protein
VGRWLKTRCRHARCWYERVQIKCNCEFKATQLVWSTGEERVEEPVFARGWMLTPVEAYPEVQVAESCMRDYMKRVKEWFPLAIGTIYLLGYAVVAFHLAGYGASSLDLIKAQYLAAGLWLSCVLIAYFGGLQGIRSAMGKLEMGARPGFRQGGGLIELMLSLSANLVLALIFGVLVIMFRYFPPPSERGKEFSEIVWREAPLLARLVASMALLDIVYRFRGWFGKRAEEANRSRQNWMLAWFFATILTIFGFANCLYLFAVSIYRTIPFSLGGGQPRQVVFWLGAGTGPSDSFLERDGAKPYSVPYELLVESESSLVVISPKDGQRAIEFDRKAVGAVFVLGKRPPTAPAHFQRGITEGPP